ncbi:MAG: transcription-repair coupling factor [Planctomycetota bacterium]
MPVRRHLIPLLREYGASAEMARAEEVLRAPRARLGGFPGASLAFFLAAWKRPGGPGEAGPALVVTASEEEAADLEEELGALAAWPVLSFPAWDSPFFEGSAVDGDIAFERLGTLERLAADPREPVFVVAPIQALIQPVPAASALEGSRIRLRVGASDLGPEALAEILARRGLRHVSLVERRGEFSWRGGVFDVFPYGAETPIRAEFFGDSIESLRAFDPETQRSLGGGGRAEVSFLAPPRDEFFRACFGGREALLFEYLGDAGRAFLREPEAILERAAKLFSNLAGDGGEARDRFLAALERVPCVRVNGLPAAGAEPGANLGFHTVERFRGGDLEGVFGRIAERASSGCRFAVYCESSAEAKRFREILEDHGLSGLPSIEVAVGPIRSGFDIPCLRAAVLTTRELFGRHVVRRVRRKTPSGRAIQSFLELSQGDLVVHLAHGIGRYLGIERYRRNGVEEEFLAIEFRGGVKVYVPVSKIDLVQKYVGSGDRPVVLDRVGGTAWAKRKDEVARAVLDLASELLEIQALRETRPGFAFPPASEWQREFEAAFPFEETPDQVEVTAAIHADMESPRPMDRLLCGDVGYGKTEIAMRATFKAVDAGKQVAILVPTTVLAQQHYRTFTERMSGFPIRIEVLSRFRTPAEQRAVVEGLASGQVDVVVGTHRLLSGDVRFRDLGLVIIDEEQRFGVAHKEKLKKMRATVDVLTLTATPIPRTLHMALLGIRDVSSLETAPEGRCPVRTEIIERDLSKFREIAIRELNRDGQIYFVHNRVEDIERVSWELEETVPEARIDYAHGQMNERELEEKMLRFFEGEIDCLVSTTIIENGLDIPNVNTMFIDEADRYGLADLHQLRGRVGRYKRQAYCYLVLPEVRAVNPDAERRLQALVEFSDLGSGFQIALRDLEIRGAGNILGPEQSGHISAVGYDLYCRLLEDAVRALKGEEGGKRADLLGVEVDLALSARIPDSYRPKESEKIAVYRRVSAAASLEAVADLAAELEDRFGPYPREVGLLLDLQRLRILCASRGISYVGREGGHLVIKGNGDLAPLLASAPVRATVLDVRTLALELSDPRRRAPSGLTDEAVFRTVLEWLETGKLPAPGAPAAKGVRGVPASRK